MGCILGCLAGMVSHILQVSEKILFCFSCAALVSCLVLTLVVILGLGIGLGYNYCYIDFRTKHRYHPAKYRWYRYRPTPHWRRSGELDEYDYGPEYDGQDNQTSEMTVSLTSTDKYEPDKSKSSQMDDNNTSTPPEDYRAQSEQSIPSIVGTINTELENTEHESTDNGDTKIIDTEIMDTKVQLDSPDITENFTNIPSILDEKSTLAEKVLSKINKVNTTANMSELNDPVKSFHVNTNSTIAEIILNEIIKENATASSHYVSNNNTIEIKNNSTKLLIPISGLDLISLLTKLKTENRNYSLQIVVS